MRSATKRRKAYAAYQKQTPHFGVCRFCACFSDCRAHVFEPDNTYADRTAKTLIPPLEDVKPAAVVIISQTEEAAKNLREPPASQSAVDSAAKSLSRANPVTASASLAAGSETPASAAKNDEKPVRKAGVVSEEKPREAAAKKTEPVKTAKAADAKPAQSAKVAKPAAGKRRLPVPTGLRPRRPAATTFRSSRPQTRSLRLRR